MKSFSIVACLGLAAMCAPAFGQTPDTADYDRCLAEAAVQESRTDASDEAVFVLARQRCAATRASLARKPEMLAALDAADAARAAAFPEFIGRLRERRQLRTAGSPIPADPGYR